MESKLKALKVADLKDILVKAQQSPPPKATKSDLIARIIASKEATDVYNAKFAPKDDLLAPPEDLDWDVDQVNPPETPAESTVSRVTRPLFRAQARYIEDTIRPPPPQRQVAKPAPSSASASTLAAPATTLTPAASASSTDGAKTAEELELEKRRQRAERFGIPLVETVAKPPTVKKSKAAAPAAVAVAGKVPDQAAEKLTARAARFGTGQKRSAPSEEVDPEEQERRRKRAERFGTGATAKDA
ncbi:hypothetical protein MVEN_00547300 [Mycena venus]|uniref:THO1-MOS11 C-terminal domain-containing protein n=1 Tax=Mycena venus TaxID=2733690 RepID=A0A8H7D7V3_9AGAR|nr:hypothetical protein MVEN_00547300 [Mycena venus]